MENASIVALSLLEGCTLQGHTDCELELEVELGIIVRVDVVGTFDPPQLINRLQALCRAVDHSGNVSALDILRQWRRIPAIDNVSASPFYDNRLVPDTMTRGWNNFHTILDLVRSADWQELTLYIEKLP